MPAPRPHRWNIPGVTYPPEPKPRRYTLPAGCPEYVATLNQFAVCVQRARLWPGIPSHATCKRWRRSGLIVTKRGAAGVPMIDVAASLQLLTPKNQH